MQKNLKSLLATIALALPLSGVAQTGSTIQQDLLHVANQSWTAFEHSDWAMMQTITTPDFVFVGPPGVLNGEQLAKAAQSCKLKSFSLSDGQVRMQGKNAAVLVYVAHQDYSCNGKPEPSVLLVADSFTRKGGSWLIVSHAETESAAGEGSTH